MLHLFLVILIFQFWTLSWFVLLEISCPEHKALSQSHTTPGQSGRFILHVQIAASLLQDFNFCISRAFLVRLQTDLQMKI